MRKTILALAMAGAFAGMALPASAQWHRDHDDRDYRPYRYHSYERYRPDSTGATTMMTIGRIAIGIGGGGGGIITTTTTTTTTTRTITIGHSTGAAPNCPGSRMDARM
jgi:hypothetical protein